MTNLQLFPLIRLLGFEPKLHQLARDVETKAYDLSSEHAEQWSNIHEAILDTWDLYANTIGKTRLQAFPLMTSWLRHHNATIIVDLMTDMTKGMKEVSKNKNYEFQSQDRESLRVNRTHSRTS